MAVNKALSREPDQPIYQIAAELGMSKETLRDWLKTAQFTARIPPEELPSKDWNAERRFHALQDSHGLSGEALNAWCREKGIFAHDLERWKAEFCRTAGFDEAEEQLKLLRQAHQQLQRELVRKDKALAEAAALLVLQKKFRALLGVEEG